MKRILLSIAALLLFAAPAYAQPYAHWRDYGSKGQTLYGLIRADTGHAEEGEYWDGNSWEPITTTHATFDIAFTEPVADTGKFRMPMPASATGNICIEVWMDANDDATPDITADTWLGDIFGYWHGATFGIGFIGTDVISAAALSAAAVAEIGAASGGGSPISPFLVDRDQTWRFDNRNQVTAANNITESVGSDSILLAMDFDEPMPALSSIATTDTVTVADVPGETEPTMSGLAVSADKTKAHFLMDASAATDGTYTVTVTITTADSQVFVRRGRLVLQ